MTGTHSAAETRGHVIRWAWLYDPLVSILALGQGRAVREMTADLADVQPGSQVLDVGCGTGDLTMVARRRAGLTGAACGIDPAPEMIAVARRKAAKAGVEIDYRIGVAEAIPFPDQSFDVILSSLMMHHLPADLKRSGLAEMRRVLAPGGRLLVVDLVRPTSGAGRFVMALLMHGGLTVGVQDLAGLMEEAGLTGVEMGGTKYRVLGYARATR